MTLRRLRKPGVFYDLRNMKGRDIVPYLIANNFEFSKIMQRSWVPSNVKIDNCTVLINEKRCGRIMCRCVFNGKKQITKICENHFSPTLRDDTVKIRCSIACQKRWSYGTTDTKCSFPYAVLPEHNKLLYANIPDGH